MNEYILTYELADDPGTEHEFMIVVDSDEEATAAAQQHLSSMSDMVVWAELSNDDADCLFLY